MQAISNTHTIVFILFTFIYYVCQSYERSRVIILHTNIENLLIQLWISAQLQYRDQLAARKREAEIRAVRWRRRVRITATGTRRAPPIWAISGIAKWALVVLTRGIVSHYSCQQQELYIFLFSYTRSIFFPWSDLYSHASKARVLSFIYSFTSRRHSFRVHSLWVGLWISVNQKKKLGNYVDVATKLI